MNEVARLLLMILLAGAALTLLGGLAVRLDAPDRRVRRGLRKVLGGEPHALVVAQGRGRGVGFDFARNELAVAWDAGAWCLIYRVDELIGAELIIDGQVSGRVYRGESRRALDSFAGADKQVRLRLVFDDAAHPDFDLDLWLPADDARRNTLSASEAVREANRWLARTESLLRRPAPRRPAAATAPPTRRRPEPEPRPDALPFDEPSSDLAADADGSGDEAHDDETGGKALT